MEKNKTYIHKPLIIHVISNLSFGGAERLLTEFMLFIKDNSEKSKYRHAIVYLKDGPYRKILENEGIPLYWIGGSLKTGFNPFIFYRLCRIVIRLKPALIQTWLWYASLLGRLCGAFLAIPVIETVHQNVLFDGAFRAIWDSLTRYWSHTIVAVSDDIAVSINNRDKRFLYDPIRVIKNGIPTNRNQLLEEKKIALRLEYNVLPHEKCILAVGRLVPIKNFSLLLAIFRNFLLVGGRAKLILIGSGPLKHHLKQQALDLGVHDFVIFAGGINATPFFSIADIFVQSSISEGISIALLEAMQHELPALVASATKAHHPVVTDLKNGCIFDATDPVGASIVLKTLLDDSNLRGKLGKTAAETISSLFSIERMHTEYQNLYDQLQRKPEVASILHPSGFT